MKWLKYRLENEDGNVQEFGLAYSASNEALVKKIALDGEYSIEDDEQPEPAEAPSQLDIIEAQVTYTAMMTDTLLEV